MWICDKCGEQIGNQFDSCWKCSAPKQAPPPADIAHLPPDKQWRLTYKIFRGTFTTWENVFDEACAFANSIDPQRVVSISHSDANGGIVTVWFWALED